MLLVSTGKTTVLSDFADLETKSIYQHQNAETTDFQFYSGSNVFVEVNKKSGLEVMRVKTNDELSVKIQRILTLKIENAYCVGCAHQSSNEIALGLSNGQVRVYNYRNSEMLHRFPGEKMNSVIYVDYNAADDYIAATHENGLINVYGNKTRAKIESINFNSQPILAKFHPTKRFHLSVTTQKGAVIVYDTGAKRKVFLSTDSHNAPCRDCTWSLASPDTLISVGYDCVVNIFDTRRKGSPCKLAQKYPLSTVALSDCGRFFCVGNLKGGLATFDMRNTKSELCFKKIHDGAVNRVSFVPELNKDLGQDSFGPAENVNSMHEEANAEGSSSTTVQRTESGERRKSMLVSTRGQRDSFCDFMDFQMNKGVEKTSSRLTTLASRDSFDWEHLLRKPTWTNRGSVVGTGSNLSPIKSDETESFDVSTQKSNVSQLSSQAPLREHNLILSPATKKLDQIKEEQQHEAANETKVLLNTSMCDKENINALLLLPEQQENFSTPIAATPLPLATKTSNSPTALNDIKNQIEKLRADMDLRFKDLESDFKFEAERNKWQIFSQANNLWCKQFQSIEEIREAMMFLLQTDPFVQEFSRLKEENRTLKEQLERVLRKN